jgi:hypothetical protein
MTTETKTKGKERRKVGGKEEEGKDERRER